MLRKREKGWHRTNGGGKFAETNVPGGDTLRLEEKGLSQHHRPKSMSSGDYL